MKDTDVAYLAGLVDGEGYIGIKKSPAYKCQDRKTPGYHARIQVRMVDEPAIRFLADTLGGWYYKEKPNASKGRPLFCYQASDKRAEAILRTLYPFLRVKRAVAKKVLSLRRLQKHCRRHQTKVVGTREFPNAYGTSRRIANRCLSDQYVGWCDRLYGDCKRLNKPGV